MPSSRRQAHPAASEPPIKRLHQLFDGARGLDVALNALSAQDFDRAAEAAEAAIAARPDDGFAWYVLAMAREKQGLLMPALQAYEEALARMPDHPDLAGDLGRLALRLHMPELAAPLFAHVLQARPGSRDATVNLAAALRDQHRYAEAIEVLKPAAQAAPEDATLWDALGQALTQQGDLATAVVFFDEALRLDPGFTGARFNRSGARLELGDVDGALADGEAALAAAAGDADRAVMGYGQALTLLAAGRILDGWKAYAARLDPDFPGAPRFAVETPQWRPGQTLAGRKLLVIGEQGLGDEVMFAGLIPDVLAALGPRGRLVLAVEPRLVDLFRRSFPQAVVGAHSTDRLEARPVRGVPFLPEAGPVDVFAPMAALLETFRPGLDAFPDRAAYLAPDPARVRHWQGWLSTLPAGPKVGVVWKSLKLGGERRRAFAPFEALAPLLETPGAVFVNLQYGDVAAEIAAAARAGVLVSTPPGLDLKDDLDGVAALCAALDLVVGPANASTQIAGAVGAPLWLLMPPAAWTTLGSGRYPWHPRARTFACEAYDWEAPMRQAADALEQLIRQASR